MMKDHKEKRLIAAQNATQYKTIYRYFAQEKYDNFFDSRKIEFAGKTESSLRFVGKGLQCLSNVFELKLPAKNPPECNYSLFKARFLESAFGEGNEANEITQLNSSALLALMFFYSINDMKPLYLPVPVNGVVHKLKFTNVLFEKENPVYAANHPSSIDIALYGVDEETAEKVVLFLESKFGEYLTAGDCAAGKSYREDYLELETKRMQHSLLKGIEFTCTDIPKVSGKSHYCQGIKQMISHYIGAKQSYEANVEQRAVYLGTILFDFGTIENSQTSLEQYKKDYAGLSKILNSIEDNTSVKVVDSAFTYQQIFGNNQSFQVDPSVRELYL